MTEQQYLAICEQVCRNIFNRLEDLELYEKPTVSEYEEFHSEVKKQISGYQDALEKFREDMKPKPSVYETRGLIVL